MQEKLEQVRPEDAKSIVLTLAHASLKDRRGDVLKFCLDRKFAWGGTFLDAANKFEKNETDPEIIHILQDSEFRKVWQWPIPKRVKEEWEETDLAEAFDYGGKYEVIW
jgi:hypothetical protein